jgi:CHASE3 domain sensor protein
MFSKTKVLIVLKKRQIKFCFALVLLFTLSLNSYAQCAMCRASLASEGNKTKAEAVNDGIVYLMVIPYVLVGGIGYAIYRMKKK